MTSNEQKKNETKISVGEPIRFVIPRFINNIPTHLKMKAR